MDNEETPRLTEYLNDAIRSIERILQYIQDVDEAAFLQHQKTQDAVIRNFEILGEACNHITKHYSEFAATHPDVLWDSAYEMRNELVHDYFKVDMGKVWSAIHFLPKMARRIEDARNANN
jgi:uncharacterized protein with HEPN domain